MYSLQQSYLNLYVNIMYMQGLIYSQMFCGIIVGKIYITLDNVNCHLLPGVHLVYMHIP